MDKFIPIVNLLLTCVLILGGLFYTEGGKDKENALIIQRFTAFEADFKKFADRQWEENKEIRERLARVEREGNPK
jgi:hypothetical protein